METLDSWVLTKRRIKNLDLEKKALEEKLKTERDTIIGSFRNGDISQSDLEEAGLEVKPFTYALTGSLKLDDLIAFGSSHKALASKFLYLRFGTLGFRLDKLETFTPHEQELIRTMFKLKKINIVAERVRIGSRLTPRQASTLGWLIKDESTSLWVPSDTCPAFVTDYLENTEAPPHTYYKVLLSTEFKDYCDSLEFDFGKALSI